MLCAALLTVRCSSSSRRCCPELQLWAGGVPVIEVGDTMTVTGMVVYLLSRTPPIPTEVASSSVSARLTPSVPLLTTRFMSKKTDVATVDSISGVVTGRAPGVAAIVATNAEGLSGALDVTVTPVIARVQLSSDRPSPLAIGQSATLTFRAYDERGVPIDGVPFAVNISNTSGATWAYNRQEASPHSTPLTLTLTVTGKLDAVVSGTRLYTRANRAFVDSIRVSSAATP